MNKGLSFSEKLFYYANVILTLGTAFLLKVIIKKAILETKND
jgi:hypothetical protein